MCVSMKGRLSDIMERSVRVGVMGGRVRMGVMGG